MTNPKGFDHPRRSQRSTNMISQVLQSSLSVYVRNSSGYPATASVSKTIVIGASNTLPGGIVQYSGSTFSAQTCLTHSGFSPGSVGSTEGDVAAYIGTYTEIAVGLLGALPGPSRPAPYNANHISNIPNGWSVTFLLVASTGTYTDQVVTGDSIATVFIQS